MRVRVIKPRQIGVTSIRMGPFYTVASVELGNTTTKCILMSTNLKTGELFQIAKEVRLTRDVRPPRPDEEVFGATIVGVDLTHDSVTEYIADILKRVLKKARITLDDLHFVVRSTGVTAGFHHPDEVGAIVKALADGCLAAGVPTKKMTASLRPEDLPPGIRDFTLLQKVHFDGAIASSLPPADTGVVANEMEGELVTAGIKGAAKSTDVDFRNPVMTLDFGTTLAGRITDDGYPYAKTVGSFAGLAGAIPDAIMRGSGLVDESLGCVIDVKRLPRYRDIKPPQKILEEALEIIRVERVPMDTNVFGTVPVDPAAAAESGVVLIGVDAGVNGEGLRGLKQLGAEVFATGGLPMLLATIDHVQAMIVQHLVNVAHETGVILKETSLGLTGRAITTGMKPQLIYEGLTLPDGTKWVDSHQILFVEDGLAMGAAVAARCMNSLGTPHNPMGGRKGDRCVLAARRKLQKRD